MAEFKIKDGVAIILEGTTEIEEKAFYNDTSLECVVIPKGVSEIGEYAFEGCTSLTTVILPFSVNEIGSDIFKECLKLTVIYVPAEKVDHYKNLLPGKLHIIKPVYNDMQWEEAICKVLKDEGKPMHYMEIMKKIIKNGYRINYGDTPDNSVGMYLRRDRNLNLFNKVDRGVYTLAGTSATEEMSWEEAIRKVLIEAGEPMHYKDITRTIIEKRYRLNFGDTPERTVSNRLTTNPELFKRVGRGVYELVETSVTDEINWDDIDWDFDDIDWDEDIKEDESNYKKASDFIKSTVPSQDGKELLELIVNFRLPLEKGKVYFADILDKLEVKFSDEDKKRDQTIDKALLEEKLLELKEQIAEIEHKIMQDQILGDLLGALRNNMHSAAEEAECLLADLGDKVKFQVPIYGEFIPGKDGEDKPKVVIYYENIKRICKRIYCEEWKFLAGVFVHEMFHAWNYFKAEQKPRSVLAIDEPMVEFETLYFLKELAAFTSSKSHDLREKVARLMRDREYRVQNKRGSVGDLAAYGFGYYLFENLSDDDSKKWIETYSKKSASINGSNKLVKEVEDTLIPIYPFKSEAKVMKLFKKIIFSRRATLATTGMSTATKIGLDVSLHDLVLACIKTIGRKCFDAQELYAFAPIFEVCVPQYQNLESALKQQLDELVNEGRLEALPHSYYSMKLASVEVKPKRPVSTPATTTKSKKAPSIAFTVEFPDDNVKFHEKNAVKTYIESLKYIGLRRVQSVGIIKNGYNLVSDVERPPEGGNKWQDYVDSKYIYTKLGNQEKKAYLYEIADKLGINIKISDI